MAPPTQWTWVWVNCGSWWWTGRPGHDWVTELTDWLNWEMLCWDEVSGFSVGKSCPTLCTPMNCTTPGSLVLHYLQKFAKIHVRWVSEALTMKVHGAPHIEIPHLHISTTAAAAKSLQLCPTLCDPIDTSPPGSPVPGILQARTLEWVAISFFKCMKVKNESEVSQSCLSLSDPMDCSLPGSSVHGIFQSRVLKWSAIAFSHISTSISYFSLHISITWNENTKLAIPSPNLQKFWFNY